MSPCWNAKHVNKNIETMYMSMATKSFGQARKRPQTTQKSLRVTQYLTEKFENIIWMWYSSSAPSDNACKIDWRKRKSKRKCQSNCLVRKWKHSKNIPAELWNCRWHHLWSIIFSRRIRLDACGSRILRSNDNANVSILLHGVAVVHRSFDFHLTYSVQPVDGWSHGSSNKRKIIINI